MIDAEIMSCSYLSIQQRTKLSQMVFFCPNCFHFRFSHLSCHDLHNPLPTGYHGQDIMRLGTLSYAITCSSMKLGYIVIDQLRQWLNTRYYRGVATSMIARLKQPRNDFSAAPHFFKCKTTIKSWRGFLCRTTIKVATPR